MPTDISPEALRQYAFLGDGERGALVGPRGEIAWLCFPRWHSPALLSSLLGGPGVFQVVPDAPAVWGGFYEDSSLIWCHRWTTPSCEIQCDDALALTATPDAMTILRRVQTLRGDSPILVRLDLRGEFGRFGLRELRRDEDGVWRGRVGDAHVALRGAAEAEVVRDGRTPTLELRLRLAAGEARDLVLTVAEHAADADPPEPGAAWEATREGWRRRMDGAPQASALRDAQHSRAVLSGLTAKGGAMVAAATTSLPERAHQGREYDYRYVWIRDLCFAGMSGVAAQDRWLTRGAVQFISERLHEHGPKLSPAYTVTGERVPEERMLDLPGYPGGGVRIGNRVRDQWQLDVFGDSLLLFAAADAMDELDEDAWTAAEIAIRAIEENWTRKDAGIWELDDHAWTHSRLTCAAGLRAIAGRPRSDGPAARWAGLADRIVADTTSNALHPTGRLQRAPDDPRVDASLLLPIIRGALAPGDPRAEATLRAVRAELMEDDYVYRFRHDDRPLASAEGAFLFCSFTLSLAHVERGEIENAIVAFERGRTSCGPPALYTEEYDVLQRQLRGNLPQAFVHAMMLETAHRLGDAR